MRRSRIVRRCLICVFAVVAFGATASAASAANYRDTVLQTPGAVGYWRLGEASGTSALDETGVQNATYSGGVTLGAPGALLNDANTSAQVVGSSSVSASARSAYDVNGFTVEMWVYLTSYGDTTSWRILADKGTSSSQRNWLIGLNAGTQGQVVYSFSDGGTAFQNGWSTANLALNRWYHLAFTHVPGTKMQLFVNGQLDSEQAVTSTPVTSASSVVVPANGTNDRVDEFALYNRALSASEINQHYQAGVSTDTTPPDTTITSAPSDPTTSTSASFSFTSTEAGSTFECSLDGGAYGRCDSPASYTNLTTGTHTFNVRARDPAGNPDPTPATRSWTINTSPTCLPVYGSFGIDNWPAACWRPYASTSPFNTPLPATPALDANSANIVGRVTSSWAPGSIAANNDGTKLEWKRPTYYSSASDPVYHVSCTAWWYTNSDCLNGAVVHVPVGAQWAGGTDGHMNIIDQANGHEYDFWRVASIQAGSSGPGMITTSSAGTNDVVNGSGIRGGTTAAGFANLAGLIRAQELAAGKIDHALFMTIPCGTTDSTGKPAFVYPAGQGDSTCSDPTNAPSMGARFQLNMTDSEIDALPDPAWRKTVYKAMAHYGMYFGDTGGGNNWGIQAESDLMYGSFGRPRLLLNFALNNGWRPVNDTTLGRTIYFGDLAGSVDWAHKLRVVAPCVTQGTC